MFDVIKEILISEKQFIEANYKRLQEDLQKKSNLIDTGDGMYLTVDSFIEINDNAFREVNVNSYGFNKMYVDKELEDKLYQIIYQFNDRNYTSKKFYSILLNKIYLFYDGNGRTCKIEFADDIIIRQNI